MAQANYRELQRNLQQTYSALDPGTTPEPLQPTRPQSAGTPRRMIFSKPRPVDPPLDLQPADAPVTLSVVSSCTCPRRSLAAQVRDMVSEHRENTERVFRSKSEALRFYRDEARALERTCHASRLENQRLMKLLAARATEAAAAPGEGGDGCPVHSGKGRGRMHGLGEVVQKGVEPTLGPAGALVVFGRPHSEGPDGDTAQPATCSTNDQQPTTTGGLTNSSARDGAVATSDTAAVVDMAAADTTVHGVSGTSTESIKRPVSKVTATAEHHLHEENVALRRRIESLEQIVEGLRRRVEVEVGGGASVTDPPLPHPPSEAPRVAANTAAPQRLSPHQQQQQQHRWHREGSTHATPQRVATPELPDLVSAGCWDLSQGGAMPVPASRPPSSAAGGGHGLLTPSSQTRLRPPSPRGVAAATVGEEPEHGSHVEAHLRGQISALRDANARLRSQLSQYELSTAGIDIDTTGAALPPYPHGPSSNDSHSRTYSHHPHGLGTSPHYERATPGGMDPVLLEELARLRRLVRYLSTRLTSTAAAFDAESARRVKEESRADALDANLRMARHELTRLRDASME